MKLKKSVKVRIVIVLSVIITVIIVQMLYNGGVCKFSIVQKSVNCVVYPFEKAISFTASKISNTKKYFKDIDDLKEENKSLKKEIIDLEKYISKIMWLDQENQRLRNTLDLKNSLEDYKFVGANIIARDATNWFEIFTVDKGLKDGVYENSFVVFDKGLVGRVYKVSQDTANVISIIDRDSVVGVRLTKTRDIAVLKGDMLLRDVGCCRLEYIPDRAQIEIGDIVETSGVGEYFPKGIEVGRVCDIQNPKDRLERYAIVKPSVDLKIIEEVLVSIKN